MAKKYPIGGRDPHPYDGPIERADGVRPYNHYLWPTESWWPEDRDLGHCVHSRWHFGIVALADGRFSVEGSVFSIERNTDGFGRPCVFGSRTEAIRTAAARMLRMARRSRKWEAFGTGKLEGSRLAAVINWARQIVARETGEQDPRLVHVKEPPPIRHKTGLPLFDY